MPEYIAEFNWFQDFSPIDLTRTLGTACGECSAESIHDGGYKFKVTTKQSIPDDYIKAFHRLGVNISALEEKI